TRAIVSSVTRLGKWAISREGSIETNAADGWRTATCIFNRPAANAGHGIYVEVAATTKFSNADAPHVTTFAAGWNTVCRPTYGFWRSVRSISLHDLEVEISGVRDRWRPGRCSDSPTVG